MSTTDGHYETYLAGYGAGIDERISPEQEATAIDQAYQAGYADGERDQRHRGDQPADLDNVGGTQLIQILNHAKWVKLGQSAGKYARYSPSHNPFETQVILPLDPAAADYQQMMDAARRTVLRLTTIGTALSAAITSSSDEVHDEREHTDVREFPRAQELKRATQAGLDALDKWAETHAGMTVDTDLLLRLAFEAAWPILTAHAPAGTRSMPHAQAWLPEVLAEQERAKLLGENDHTKVKRAGRPVMFDHGDDPRWLPALARELGEVAHALIYEDSGADLAVELIQVAAVAVSWREALRRDSLRRMAREGEAAGIYDLPPEPTDPRAGGDDQ